MNTTSFSKISSTVHPVEVILEEKKSLQHQFWKTEPADILQQLHHILDDTTHVYNELVKKILCAYYQFEEENAQSTGDTQKEKKSMYNIRFDIHSNYLKKRYGTSLTDQIVKDDMKTEEQRALIQTAYIVVHGEMSQINKGSQNKENDINSLA